MATEKNNRTDSTKDNKTSSIKNARTNFSSLEN